MPGFEPGTSLVASRRASHWAMMTWFCSGLKSSNRGAKILQQNKHEKIYLRVSCIVAYVVYYKCNRTDRWTGLLGRLCLFSVGWLDKPQPISPSMAIPSQIHTTQWIDYNTHIEKKFPSNILDYIIISECGLIWMNIFAMWPIGR